MPVINRIASFHKDMTAWRHDIHSHPETAFEEVRTADVVAAKLESFGIEVHRGLAKTGVVGVLRSGTSNRAIGLRAKAVIVPHRPNVRVAKNVNARNARRAPNPPPSTKPRAWSMSGPAPKPRHCFKR